VTRRKDDGDLVEIVVAFADLPLWAAPVGALGMYAILRYALPALFGKSLYGAAFASVSIAGAPWVAGAIVVSGVVGALRRLMGRAGDRRILGRQVSIDSIRALSWSDFERMLAAAYRDRGYEVTLTARGADGGVDHVLKRAGQTTYLQAKHWKSRMVGVDRARELYGVAMADGVSTSILVTSGHFSEEAKAFASHVGMTLVDAEGLMPLVRPFLGGQLVTRGASAAGCPICGSDMVVRTAGRGPRAGSRFLGCSRFPKCRGTRQMAA
jgi:restriction system protein